MNNRLVLSLLLVANVGVAGSAAPKQSVKNSFLRSVAAEPVSSTGIIDGLIGTLWPDTIQRRWYEAWNFWGWASELDRYQYSYIYATVGEICERMNVPMPDLYVIKNSEFNAEVWMGKINAVVYGWSPRFAAITLTQDSIDLLSEEELQAYLTQAVAQIKNRRVKIYCCLRDFIDFAKPQAAVMSALASGVGIPWLLITIGAQRWLRSKVQDADRMAVHHLKNPEALASAIEKENEHAGFPYKLGSNSGMELLNNWPTAAVRLGAIANALKRRQE